MTNTGAERGWLGWLNEDPIPWLLTEDAPAVRAAALQRLLDRPPDDPDVLEARAAAMRVDPVRAILDAQDPAGWWDRPGPGYAPKYTGTVWQVIFLDQLGADPTDARVHQACEYVLRWCPTAAGGFGAALAGREAVPPPSAVVHCLNGNLMRALIGFGWIDDPRLQAAVDWAARAIAGEGIERWYRSGTCAPGFACAANDGQPCAWGAVKELLGLARVPAGRRTPLVRRAIDRGVEFLLSRDPAVADYPMGYGNTRPSSSWFRLGFPSGYVTDVLQVLEALTELGQGGMRGSATRSSGCWVSRTVAGGGATVTPTTARPRSTSSPRGSLPGGSRCAPAPCSGGLPPERLDRHLSWGCADVQAGRQHEGTRMSGQGFPAAENTRRSQSTERHRMRLLLGVGMSDRPLSLTAPP